MVVFDYLAYTLCYTHNGMPQLKTQSLCPAGPLLIACHVAVTQSYIRVSATS